MPKYNHYPEIHMEGAISFIFERKVAINFYFTDATDENCFAVSTFFENRFIFVVFLLQLFKPEVAWCHFDASCYKLQNNMDFAISPICSFVLLNSYTCH